MTQVTADQILQDIQEGNIDLGFNVETEMQSVIVGDGLDFTTTIINKEGKTIYHKKYNSKNTLPNAKELLEKFIKDNEKGSP